MTDMVPNRLKNVSIVLFKTLNFRGSKILWVYHDSPFYEKMAKYLTNSTQGY